MNSYSPAEIISSISHVATASQQLRFQWFYAVIQSGDFPPGHPPSDTCLDDLNTMILCLEFDGRTYVDTYLRISAIPSSLGVLLINFQWVYYWWNNFNGRMSSNVGLY